MDFRSSYTPKTPYKIAPAALGTFLIHSTAVSGSACEL